MNSAEGAEVLRVMTWNIRNGNPDQGHEWPDRRIPLAEVLHDIDPDILCVQEAFANQLADLRDMLPDHDVIGRGRDADPEAGEFTALFVRRSRFDVVDSGVFWLSDTPDVSASITWGNSLTRICVWARGTDRSSGREVSLAGTHVDHEPGEAGDRVRRLGAALIGDRLAVLPDPVLLMGDFNEDIAHGSFAELEVRGFQDLGAAASHLGGDLGTFHGYREPVQGGDRIDWILSHGEVAVRDIRTVDDPRTRVASDHFPVVVDLTLAG